MRKEVRVGVHPVDGKPFTFIGGPCVIEGRDATLKAAEKLAVITQRLGLPFIFKSSYDKANRTSVESYRGPGIEEGLKILQDVKDNFGVPVLTDVHSPREAALASEVADVIQADLLVACGRTGRVVNVKKGQFLAPEDMVHALRKVESTGNEQILVTERGTSFGYHNLVNDFRSLPIMREFGYPVIFDATHSVQLPGGAGASSAGRREFVFPLARAAVAVGVEGIFMEVHEDPAYALCDGENSVRIADLAGMLEVLKRIGEAL